MAAVQTLIVNASPDQMGWIRSNLLEICPTCQPVFSNLPLPSQQDFDLILFFLHNKVDWYRVVFPETTIRFAVVDEYEPEQVHRLYRSGFHAVLSTAAFGENLKRLVDEFFSEMQAPTALNMTRPFRTDHSSKELLQLRRALESSALAGSVIQALSVLILVLDKDGQIILFNPRCEQVSGYTENEVKGKRFQDFLILPEEKDGVLRAFDRMRTRDHPVQHQNFWVTRDGLLKRLEWSNSVLRSPDGKIEYVVGIGLDITDAYEISQALKRSEERFARIFQISPIGLMMVAIQDGTLLDINESALRLVGASRGELLDRRNIDSPLFKEVYRDVILDAEATSTPPAAGRVVKFDSESGLTYYLHLSYEFVEWSGKMAALVLLQDVTRQTEYQESIRLQKEALELRVTERTEKLEKAGLELKSEIGRRQAAEQLSQHLVNVIWETPDVMAMSDPSGKLLYLNKAGREFMQISETAPVNLIDFHEVYTPDSKKTILNDALAEALSHNEWRGELEFQRPDGRVVPFSQVILVHRSEDGRPRFISTIARDITLERNARNELLNAYEQVKRLGQIRNEFFSMTSHQFRTPLSIILSSAELLEHYGRTWGEEKKTVHLRRIEEAAAAINHLLDDILFISRSESGEQQLSIEVVDLVSLCQRVMDNHSLLKQKERNFNFMRNTPSNPIHTDPAVVEKILDNLLGNAVKFSPAGSTISVRLLAGEKETQITVSDQGHGIPEDELDRIFEPFMRGRRHLEVPGTGLGLMIVDRSIRMLNGRIHVESKLNQGTSVHVWIPDADESIQGQERGG